jgi:hypothetical protein
MDGHYQHSIFNNQRLIRQYKRWLALDHCFHGRDARRLRVNRPAAS